MNQMNKSEVQMIMCWVIAASTPALTYLIYWQGAGFLLHLAIAALSGFLFEAIILKLRKRELKMYLLDGSTVITAILLTAGIPAMAPFWLTVIGMFFAIVIAKQLFGGLGHNIFNPAMVGYAVLLIAFPQHMVVWPAWSIDALTSATPLDLLQTQRLALPLDIQTYEGFFILSGLWFAGGCVLLMKRIISWHIPVGVLSGALFTALILSPLLPYPTVNPIYQLGLGAMMIGAFFIATDPVTAPAHKAARFIYGLLIGVLIICLRFYSNYPDGVAFAVLLANIAGPMLDQIMQQRKVA